MKNLNRAIADYKYYLCFLKFQNLSQGTPSYLIFQKNKQVKSILVALDEVERIINIFS
jgi:hypothetical protein